MYSLLGFLLVCTMFWTGAYKEWRTYLTTIQYVIIGNLLYNLLCSHYKMWKFIPSFLPNHTTVELVEILTTFPSLTLLFLVRFPSENRLYKKLIYVSAWAFFLTVIEYFTLLSGNIAYENGWTLLWSLGFNHVMFSMMRLHSIRPGLTYILSIIIIIILLWIFRVPFYEYNH